jgi:hypothetical protein
VYGYHSNQLRWYDQLTRRDQRDNIRSIEDMQTYWFGFLRSPALRALSARVAILPFRVELPGYHVLGSDRQKAIYRDSTALPAVNIIPSIRVEADSVKRLDLLWDPTFDVSREVLVDAPIPSLGAGGGTGSARLVADGADSVAIEATTTGPAMLLLSRTFHPSWKATVDGAAVVAIRVDHALIGVPLVSGGTHSVSLAYRPAVVAEARLVTTVSWVIVVLGTLASWGVALRERRRRV